jgi:hypothetical protein
VSSIAIARLPRPFSKSIGIFFWIVVCLAVADPEQRAGAAVILEVEKDNFAFNNTLGTAQVIAPGDFTFDPNPDIFTPAEGGFSGSALSVSIVGHTGGGVSNDVDFYEFTVFNNGYIWLDVDGPRTTFHDPDVTLGLFDSTGTLIAWGDDSFFDLNADTIADADPGSHLDAVGQGTYDAFLGAVPVSAGTYYISAGEYGNFPNAISSGTPTQHDSSFYPVGFTWWITQSGATFGDSTWGNSGVQLPAVDYVLHISQVESVPEPSSLALMIAGGAAVAWFACQRRKLLAQP